MVIGGKAKGLMELIRAGERVPPFFVHDAAAAPTGLADRAERELPGVRFFAVRSSASVEDSAERSYAGSFHSSLAVARGDLDREAAKVIESFGGIEGTVIVQEFIGSDAAGVLFTRVRGGSMLINATRGLCEPVVRGEACDEYALAESGALRSASIAAAKPIVRFKDGAFVRSSDGRESLTPERLAALFALGRRIEAAFGAAQDVEWCFRGSKLYALQARPITRALGSDIREFYDSANIAESYSGIVLPLTASFASMVYGRIYRDLLAMSGVSRRKLEHHAYAFDQLLAFFYGRMYYAMGNWYRLAQFAPGYGRNKRNFELMITSNVRAEISASTRPSLALRFAYPFIIAFKFLFFDTACASFERCTERELKELRRLDFATLGYADCIALFDRMNAKLLARWYIPVENDFFVMTYLGLLTARIPEEALLPALVFPSKATEQVEALSALAGSIAEIAELWDSIVADDPERFRARLPAHAEQEKALASYLDAFGGRFANELKLESIGVDEDDHKLFAVLKAYRGRVETRREATVARFPFPLSVLRAGFRKHAMRREVFRLLRSNAFGMTRRLVRRMGAILVAAGTMDASDDAFYLKLEELFQPDAPGNPALRGTVAARKREYDSYADALPATHFSLIEGELPDAHGTERPVALLARPASPGVVRGRVRVFKEFSLPDPIDFEILVASHTDPGWTSLIALSKGLVIEHGGVLSHASIVARELGVPAVIGAAGATDTLVDGQMVEIDGMRGTITLV